MKQLLSLFLFLLPCVAWAQYPSNGNQKITLGEQTSANGLIWRGVAATDTVRKPSIDTMAYMVLDTTTNIMWHYKKATSNAWLRLNLLPSDTASMLTNYYRSGKALGTPSSGILTSATGLPIGTGLTGLGAANRIPYASSTTALTTSENFTYDGLRLNLKKSNNFSIFIGTAAGNTNAGDDNVCIGYLAGFKIKSSGAGNLLLGNLSGFSDSISGFYNAGLGSASLYSLSSGNYNLGVGANSLYYVTTGSSNIGIGNNSGGTLSTGSNNIYIGDGTTRSSTSVTNEIVFGVNAVGQGSNSIMLGNSSITKTILNGNVGIGTASPLALLNVMGTVRINSASAPDANYYLQLENSSSQKAKANAWDTYSDSRIKTNRQPIINAIDKINLLNPTYYNQHDSYVEDDLLNIDYNNSYKSLGFIAQEVYEVIPEAVNMGTTNELWAMDYTKLIPILTKAIQEQQALIKALEQRIINLENK
jgi:uncharacterized protein YqkB